MSLLSVGLTNKNKAVLLIFERHCFSVLQILFGNSLSEASVLLLILALILLLVVLLLILILILLAVVVLLVILLVLLIILLIHKSSPFAMIRIKLICFRGNVKICALSLNLCQR